MQASQDGYMLRKMSSIGIICLFKRTSQIPFKVIFLSYIVDTSWFVCIKFTLDIIQSSDLIYFSLYIFCNEAILDIFSFSKFNIKVCCSPFVNGTVEQDALQPTFCEFLFLNPFPLLSDANPPFTQHALNLPKSFLWQVYFYRAPSFSLALSQINLNIFLSLGTITSESKNIWSKLSGHFA